MHANDGNHPLNAQHRSDSFPSLDENDDDYDGDESYKRSSLEDENERLRQELHQYKRRVVILQGKLNQHSPSKKSHKPSVLLELPRTLKKAATKKFCRSQSLKDHQSFSTDDDQDTIEPNMELEIHQSLGGLYHRGGASHQIQASTSSRSIGSGNHSPLKATSVGSSPITRKTDTTATANSNDDSFSSTDDHLLEEGLEEELERGETRDLLGNRTRVAESSQSQQQRQQEDESFYSILSDRAGWLVGLLVLQSMSSFILARNEALLEQHLVIVQFLTMLVGAGGNAGNQASVRGMLQYYIYLSCHLRFYKNQRVLATLLILVISLFITIPYK